MILFTDLIESGSLLSNEQVLIYKFKRRLIKRFSFNEVDYFTDHIISSDLNSKRTFGDRFLGSLIQIKRFNWGQGRCAHVEENASFVQMQCKKLSNVGRTMRAVSVPDSVCCIRSPFSDYLV